MDIVSSGLMYYKPHISLIFCLVAWCRSILAICEQIIRLRFWLGELLAFNTAVSEMDEMQDLSMESAAYRVIEDIQYYTKLGGMKKELYNTSMPVFIMSQFSARQNKAIISLIKLQSHGVTEDQILHLHKYVERNNSLFNVKDRTIWRNKNKNKSISSSYKILFSRVSLL